MLTWCVFAMCFLRPDIDEFFAQSLIGHLK